MLTENTVFSLYYEIYGNYAKIYHPGARLHKAKREKINPGDGVSQ